MTNRENHHSENWPGSEIRYRTRNGLPSERVEIRPPSDGPKPGRPNIEQWPCGRDQNRGVTGYSTRRRHNTSIINRIQGLQRYGVTVLSSSEVYTNAG